MASRKIRHYFLVHAITVPMSYPLALMLRNKDASGRIGKWAAELAPFDITFVARTAIKSQSLADFVAEWTPQAEGQSSTLIEAPWTVHTDGSWCATEANAVARAVGHLCMCRARQCPFCLCHSSISMSPECTKYKGTRYCSPVTQSVTCTRNLRG